MTGNDEHLVDYDAHAERYHEGRSLDQGQIERWTAAIAARLPDGPLALVVDLGAGTGTFLSVWHELGAARILGVEPSDAMRAVAAGREITGAELHAGHAASIPADDGSADVVWMSAVFHHVPDLRAAFAEIARVLRPGGRVLVRELVPGSSHVSWLDHLAGRDRALARFPRLDDIRTPAEAVGLRLADVDVVADTDPVDPAAAVEWITRMRNVDTLLTALSDDEIAAGITALGDLGDDPLPPVTLTLATFDAP